MSLLDTIAAQLRAQGIDPSAIQVQCPEHVGSDNAGLTTAEYPSLPMRVVCVSANLKDSVQALGATNRDHVVMVRVDGETLLQLDTWVETGALRSRSEAAALFIREGLAVRGDELRRMESAIAQVREAKERLRSEAQAVLGSETEAPLPKEDT